MSEGNVRTVSQAQERLRLYMEAVGRQTAYLDALVDAPMPDDLTREEAEEVVQRFAQLVREAGPRRGLCRFERPAVEA